MTRDSINLTLGFRAMLIVTLLSFLLPVGKSVRPYHPHFTHHDKSGHAFPEELYSLGGSGLPDCSRACGACSPCKRVMVSFNKCLLATEPCPVVYRCKCRGKYYHVPSN